MNPYFDSRDKRCKEPFGAVAAGTAVHFALQDETYYGCELLVRREFAGAEDVCPLPPAEGGFAGSYTAPGNGELCWYGFRFTRDDGSTVCLGKNGWCGQDALTRWQLTVYEDTPTPAWFGEGVTYQIFPDRFRRISVPETEGMVGHRWVHPCWDDQPVFLPEENGQITNRDFFGGSLAGITEKLDYLQSLSVSTIYLNPIFEADSNHRYNTADYLAIDPMLGTEEDFRELCRQAHKRGMRLLLDGVFNHTGSVSRYFNRDGFYPELGAAQSQASPYYNWYHFTRWPEEYDAWWGIKTLPAVDEGQDSYRAFIIRDRDSVVRRWLRAGADGWRLDVADELPDDFIREIRRAMEEEKPDAVLIGEVWEDGTTKVAYSKRRRYLLGSGLHGLMNYPFRTALLPYLAGTSGAEDFRDAMETIRENYPSPAFYGAMNFLSTHDTPRLLTLLGCEQPPADRDARAHYRLSPAERERGTALLKLAALVLYAFPGSPTVYYGDEAGMEGFEDPFNRRTYPWGHEDTALLDWFRTLGRLRAERESLQSGDIAYPLAAGRVLCFARRAGDEVSLCAVNAGAESASVDLPWAAPLAHDALSGQSFLAEGGRLHISLAPYDALLLTE